MKKLKQTLVGPNISPVRVTLTLGLPPLLVNRASMTYTFTTMGLFYIVYHTFRMLR